MNMVYVTSRRRRRGLTLVEAALVLGVTALVFGGFAEVLSTQAENSKSKAVAERLNEVAAASSSYISANQAALLSATSAGQKLVIPVGRTSATGAMPDGPNGLHGVQSGGFLPSTFIDSNPYGQTHILVVTTNNTGTPHIEGLLYTDAGSLIPDRQIGRVARFMGATGGFMMQSPATVGQPAGQIIGVAGGWASPAANWANAYGTPKVGHVMATLSSQDNALTGEYLNRTNTGDPEANTMRTDLHLGDNNIDGVTNITASTTDGTNVLHIGPNISVPGYVAAGGAITSGTTITAKGAVTGSSFVDGADPTWYVVPSQTSYLNNIQATTETVGSGATLQPDKEVGASLDVKGIGYTDDLRSGRINVDTEVYGASRGLAPGTGIRLGDLLPNYVTKGQYFWSWTSATVANNIVPKPTCGPTGNAKIQVTMLSDSQSFGHNVNVDTLMTNSYLGVTSVLQLYSPPDYGYTADVFNKVPLVTGVTSGLTYTDRKFNAIDNGDNTWAVQVSGTDLAPSSAGAPPTTGLATVYCQYQ